MPLVNLFESSYLDYRISKLRLQNKNKNLYLTIS